MTEIELAARFALACLFALLAIILLRDHRSGGPGLMGGLFAIAACADQVTAPFGPRVGVIGALFQAASISGVVWFWLLAKSLFDDAFRWRNCYLFVLFGLLACSLGAYIYTDAFARVEAGSIFEFDRYKLSLIPQQAIILTLSALVIYEALRDWRNDLVEKRRRFRRIFLLAVSILLLAVSFSNYLQLGVERNRTLDAMGNLAGVVIVLLVIAALLRTRFEPVPDQVVAPFPSVQARDEDQPITSAIHALMDEQHLYTEHGLTIAKLAERLNEREYRVRRVINGSMGYRNFNQFLNHYRIQEAARRLVAADSRRLPVLTIAIDVGYSSLAPFNIAFKAIHGMTPTEYRRQHGGN